MRKFMLAMLICVMLVPLLSYAQWTVNLSRESDPLERVFGTNSIASELFDTLDEPFPPFPMSFIWYFIIPDTAMPTLWKDIRPLAEDINWFMVGVWNSPSDIQPEIIKWFPDSLPIDYGYFYFDTIPDMSTKISMSDIDSFIFNPVDPYTLYDTVYFQFIARVDTTDSFPPYAENWYPICGSESVSVNLDSFSVDIFDALSGVDPTSIAITLTGIGDITYFADITSITGGYHIHYSIPMTLPYDSDFAIQIDVSDNDGNATLLSCAWHTESADSGYAISGFVYDTLTLEPISGAGIGDVSLTYTGVSDDTGYYSISGIEDGSYLFSVYKDGYTTRSESISVSGADVSHDFYLVPAESMIVISGIVYDVSDSTPIDGAIVTSTWTGGSVTDTTDATGTYENSGISGGAATLTYASATGYVSDSIYGTYASDTTIDFYLHTPTVGYAISGAITLEGATDYSGTIVLLNDSLADTTDASGNYEFTELDAGTYELVAFHDGYETFDTSLIISDDDIDISTELAEIAAAIGPPTEVEASDSEFAGIVHITWSPPGEYTMLTYDDDDLTNSYVITLPSDQVNKVGMLYNISAPATLIKIEIGYYSDEISNCIVSTWDGSAPDEELGSEYTATLSADYMYTFDFTGDYVTLDGDFFVQLATVFPTDTIFPISDSVYTDTCDDFTYIYLPSTSSWSTLNAATTWSGFVWLIRVYVQTDDGIVMLTPNSDTHSETDISLNPSAELSTSILERTTDTEEVLTGYNIYRAEETFDSPDSPYVSLIYSAGPDENQYFDDAIEPDVEYYYGVTAVYDDVTESALSNIDVGNAIDFRPGADILVLDWDKGQNLADGGTTDEITAITDMISDMVAGADTMDIYISEQDEYLQHFILSNYQWVFVIAGNEDPYMPFYFFSDTIQFSNFLTSGTGLFIEGSEAAYYLESYFPNLLADFGASFVDDGYDSANVHYLTAVEPSFFGETDTFDVDYAYNTVPDFTADEIAPITGAEAILNSQTDAPVPVGDGTRVTYYNNGCRIVFSSIYFGSIDVGTTPPATRTAVFAKILDSLGLTTTDIAEKPAKPKTPILLSNTPNPFNATTEIRFTLPNDDNVRLEILDVSGKLVSVLIDGKFNAGTHEIIWNGMDSFGKNIPSGIYTCRLTASIGTYTTRMTLIK